MKKSSRKKAGAVTRSADTSHEDALFARVVNIIEAARGITRSVNAAMVQAYWPIRREIVDVEQRGEKRAGYGDEVIERLAQRLAGSVGQGFGARTLRRIRQFYVTHPDGSELPPELGGPAKRTAVLFKSKREESRAASPTKSAAGPAPLPPHLGWTHNLILMRVANPRARGLYEIEAARGSWSSRELERQIASPPFERLAKSRDKEEVLALAQRGHEVEVPSDVLKEPFVLEFLGLDERSHWCERDLRQAIIHRIEGFLQQLGKGFCFVARQKRVLGRSFLRRPRLLQPPAPLLHARRTQARQAHAPGPRADADVRKLLATASSARSTRQDHRHRALLGVERRDGRRSSCPRTTSRSSSRAPRSSLPTEEELRAERARERQAAERALVLAAITKPKGALRKKG